MRSLALTSTLISTLVFGGILLGLLIFRFPLWTMKAKNVMSPDPKPYEVVLGNAIAFSARSFPAVAALAVVGAWLLFARKAYTAALIVGWLPVLNVVVPIVTFVASLVYLNVRKQ